MENQINFLVDTNVWLERLLEQQKSQEAEKFFNSIPAKDLSISDFTLHSIGIILHNFKKMDVFRDFINDLSFGGISFLNLDVIDTNEVTKIINSKGLDFDDSYQLALSEK